MKHQVWMLGVVWALAGEAAEPRSAESRALSGRVMRGTQGVAGALVRTWTEKGVVSTTSDAQGVFTFNDMPPGQYDLETRQGRDIASALATVGDSEPIVLEFLPCSALEGTVKAESGAPIAGARVRFWRSTHDAAESALTDAQGRYRIDCLYLPSNFYGRIEAEGFLMRLHHGMYDDLPPGKTRRRDWVLEAAAAFKGQVVDGAGRGLPGAKVVVIAMVDESDESEVSAESASDITELPVATTGRDGRFSVGELEAGTYVVEVRGPKGWDTRKARVRLPIEDARFVLKPSTHR